MLGGRGTDDKRIAGPLNTLQLGNAGEVDKVLGGRQPQLHHGDQALAAGQHATVIAVPGEQRRGLSDALRTVIGEWGRDHGASLRGALHFF
jgi:hypothetical protein